jgi:hypothetical protein
MPQDCDILPSHAYRTDRSVITLFSHSSNLDPMTDSRTWKSPKLTELNTVVEATGQDDKIGSQPDDATSEVPSLDGKIQPNI